MFKVNKKNLIFSSNSQNSVDYLRTKFRKKTFLSLFLTKKTRDFWEGEK